MKRFEFHFTIEVPEGEILAVWAEWIKLALPDAPLVAFSAREVPDGEPTKVRVAG